MSTIEPNERRAVAVVAALTILSLGMVGVLVPTSGASRERIAQGPTPYSALHSAIPESAVHELAPQF